MKQKLFMLTFCLGMQAFMANAGYRNFTDTKGRVIEAEIVKYNPSKKTVILRCKNKGMKTVPTGIFSEKDQKYILSWNKLHFFSMSGCCP